ncbi:MAG: hypothetical protein KDK27_02870, partial [Leptospiraceae bacterium]|nr:hypothetical protein [Leptospiraceae bacterium]
MSILHKIQPGLRGKLSLFMGVMLFALIGIILAIVLRLQRETLASVAEQEVSRFLRPVETLSLDVDTVVENLIRLETLRLRIEQHERDFKNEQPDYYQRYFTENHINQAEREFRRQIKAGYRDEELSEDRWEVYRSLARWFAFNPRHTPGAQDTYEIRRHALEWKIREEFDYKNRIAIAFQPLDLARYRSESITLGRMIRFDTRDAAPPEKRRSAINSFVWGQVPEFHGAMDDIHEPFQAGEPMIEPLRLQYETEQANYFLVFRTLYRNPPVSERARIVKEVLNADAPSIWKQYAIQEGEIISRLRGLAEAIRARREKLRAEDPPTPIPRDAEILKLYAEYATEIQNRRQLVDEFRIQVFEKKDPVFAGKLEDLNALRDELQQLPDDATEEQKSQILERIGELKKVIDERSVSFTREDAVADAFEHMRDAALYYDVKIPYRPDQNLYQKYGNDPGLRRDLTYYRQNLREWILKPYNELYANEYRVGWGLLAMTRSEAEERMFELDTTPLRELYDQLLFENAAGFTRILMDETESRDRLIANRDRLLDTALSIGLRIIFLSFLLSGVLVAVIQRIIAGARRVGQGDLKVRFD